MTLLTRWLSQWTFRLIQDLIFSFSLLNSNGISLISTLLLHNIFSVLVMSLPPPWKVVLNVAAPYYRNLWLLLSVHSIYSRDRWHAPHSSPTKHLRTFTDFLHLSIGFCLKLNFESIHIPRKNRLLTLFCLYIWILTVGFVLLFVKQISWAFATEKWKLYFSDSSLHFSTCTKLFAPFSTAPHHLHIRDLPISMAISEKMSLIIKLNRIGLLTRPAVFHYLLNAYEKTDPTLTCKVLLNKKSVLQLNIFPFISILYKYFSQ